MSVPGLAEASNEGAAVKAESAAALWGYARFNITSFGPPTLQFGTFNNRPLVQANAEKLANSMLVNGIRRCEERTAIPIMVAEKYLVKGKAHTTFTENLDDYPELTDVLNDDLKQIAALGGQHRVAAMKINVEAAKDYVDKRIGEREMMRLEAVLAVAKQRLATMQKGTAAWKEEEAKVRELTIEIVKTERHAQRMLSLEKHRGEWLLKIYVQGAWNLTQCAPDLTYPPDKLTDAACDYLSGNVEDIHFASTEEETAYTWIRRYMKNEHKAAEIAMAREEDLRARIDAITSGRLRQKVEAVEGIVQEMEKYDGDLTDDNAPSVSSVEKEEGIDFDPDHPDNADLGLLERAQGLLQSLKRKLDSQPAELKELEAELIPVAETALRKDLAREMAWDASVALMKDKGVPTTLGVALATGHTRSWVQDFMRFDVYYRQLAETREKWIGAHMMSVWGGVRGSSHPFRLKTDG